LPNYLFTCFLEYESDTVKVHDLVYQKDHNGWKLNKSFYRKLRVSQEWVDRQLKDAGFKQIEYEVNNGLIVVIATK
jgi:hypothetical protein